MESEPGSAAAIDVVRLARIIAPETMIAARSRYHCNRGEFGDAGARIVHDEESHVGIRILASDLELLSPGEVADRPAPLESDIDRGKHE